MRDSNPELKVSEWVYPEREVAFIAIDKAADVEFPRVCQVFVDKAGKFTYELLGEGEWPK